LKVRKELENYQIQLHIKNGTGYYLSAASKPEVIRLLNEGLFEDNYEDNRDLTDACFVYLYSKTAPISLDDLAVEVGASKGTLNKAIKHFNDTHPNIQFVSGRKGMELKGKEYDIRMCAIQLGNQILKKVSTKRLDRKEVRDVIRELNQKYDVWHTKDSFETLVDYCLVSTLRQSRTNLEANEDYLKIGETSYAQALLSRLGLKINSSEIALLSEMLVKSHISFNYDSLQNSQLREQIHTLSHKIVKIAKSQGYSAKEEELYRDLYAHLKQLAKCMRYGIDLPSNPMLQEIKLNYPEMFSIASSATKDWFLEEGKALSESEISYIAIYLYKNIEWSQQKNKRVLIICATGKGLSSLLESKVHDRFPNLEIAGLESAYGVQNHFYDADFVISTIPLPSCPIPVAKVSAMFTKEDENKVLTLLRGNKDEKNNSSFYAEKMSLSNRESFQQFAEIQKKIVLGMTDLISNLPNKYHPSSESLLGLIIHLNMAIPRWTGGYEASDEERNKEILNAYQKDHPDLADLLNAYFKMVEDTLAIRLDASEKNAFYLYILAR